MIDPPSGQTGMKTPFSPSAQIFALRGMCQETMDTPAPVGVSAQHPSPAGLGGGFSLCEVCNLQLTSAAQARLHYNGRSHLRRVRQLRAGEAGQQGAVGTQSRSISQTSGLSFQPAGLSLAPGLPGWGLGSSSSSTAGSVTGAVSDSLPGLLGAAALPALMKPLLPFPVETTSPVGLFPNFNMMDPVQKAVINHTFGVTMVPRKKQVICCHVCQLRFNSDSQAEAHYRGSRHAKKIKSQENKAKAKLSVTEETNGSGCSPAGPAPSAGRTNQTTDLLSNPVDSPPPLRPLLPPFPSFTSFTSFTSSHPPFTPWSSSSEPPPCSPPSALPAPALSSSSASSSSSSPAAPATGSSSGPSVGYQTSSSSSSALPLQTSSSSSSSALPLQTSSSSSSSSSSSQDAPPSAESEEEKAKKLLYCSLCKVAVNSLSQLEAHNAGSKHKTMLEARSGSGPIKAFPRPGAKPRTGSSPGPKGSGLQNKTFHCQICDVHVNSEIQLKQHISSRRHKDRVAGKPTKPKYSPYNKQQRSNTEPAKSSLSPSLFSSPFSPHPSLPPSSISLRPSSLSSSPLLSRSSSPLTPPVSLRPRPAVSSSLFSFLRPAPGPIRASRGSIVFTPY